MNTSSELRSGHQPPAASTENVNCRTESRGAARGDSDVCNDSHHSSVIELVEWDTGFFGFPVGRLSIETWDEPRIADALERAARAGVRLAYVFDEKARGLPLSMLERFGGRLVDRRVTYERSLEAMREGALDTDVPDGVTIRDYAERATSPELRALALAAGQFSRFRTDERIPAGAFERLYDLWIDRSVRREIADTVLVATGAEETLVGFITMSRREDRGNIGLVAVASEARGRGIGRRLMSAADEWMRKREVSVVSVVTQAENLAACRLYESCGYRPQRREDIYHFWLSNDAR